MSAEAPQGPRQTRKKVPEPRDGGAPDGNEPKPLRRRSLPSRDAGIGEAAADNFLTNRVGTRSDVQSLLRRLSNEDGQPDES